jgi:hypothetical protein
MNSQFPAATEPVLRIENLGFKDVFLAFAFGPKILDPKSPSESKATGTVNER